MSDLTEAQKDKQAELVERELRIYQQRGRHDDILADRRKRYLAFVAAMQVPIELIEWSAAMTEKFGPKVRMHHQPALDWVVALLVARYGEHEHFWPPAFTDEDLERANQWLFDLSKWPRGAEPIGEDAPLVLRGPQANGVLS